MRFRYHHGLPAFAALAACVLVLGGCADHRATATLNAAAQSVQAGLEAWKRGDQPAALLTGATAIEFFDDDWQSAARLVEYEVLQTYMESDDAPRCAVRLVVKRGNKPPEEIKVTYQIVTKDDKAVIARDPFS